MHMAVRSEQELTCALEDELRRQGMILDSDHNSAGRFVYSKC